MNETKDSASQDKEEEKGGPPTENPDPLRTAYHEAGHGIVVRCDGYEVELSMTETCKGWATACPVDPKWRGILYAPCKLERLGAAVVLGTFALGGIAAEELIFGDLSLDKAMGEGRGQHGHIKDALEAIKQADDTDCAHRAFLRYCWERATHHLQTREKALDEVAQQLLRRDNLSSCDVRRCMDAPELRSLRDGLE